MQAECLEHAPDGKLGQGGTPRGTAGVIAVGAPDHHHQPCDRQTTLMTSKSQLCQYECVACRVKVYEIVCVCHSLSAKCTKAIYVEDHVLYMFIYRGMFTCMICVCVTGLHV